MFRQIAVIPQTPDWLVKFAKYLLNTTSDCSKFAIGAGELHLSFL